MTKNRSEQPGESWSYWRSRFLRAQDQSPRFASFVPIIDRLCELGYDARLYPGTSLDNLVISRQRHAKDRRQSILVIPTDDGVEFRLYRSSGEPEVSRVGTADVVGEISRLLPRLLEESDEKALR